MDLENIENVEEIEKEECRFRMIECTEKMYMHEIVDVGLYLRFCQNCLLGQLTDELRRLRVTGPS